MREEGREGEILMGREGKGSVIEKFWSETN